MPCNVFAAASSTWHIMADGVEPTSAAKTAAVDVPGAAEDDADAPRGRAKAEAVDDAPFRGSSDVDDDDEVDPRRRACSFLRRVALAHASKPPASLRARELFCVGDASVRYLRSKAQAAPTPADAPQPRRRRARCMGRRLGLSLAPRRGRAPPPSPPLWTGRWSSRQRSCAARGRR